MSAPNPPTLATTIRDTIKHLRGGMFRSDEDCAEALESALKYEESRPKMQRAWINANPVKDAPFVGGLWRKAWSPTAAAVPPVAVEYRLLPPDPESEERARFEAWVKESTSGVDEYSKSWMRQAWMARAKEAGK